MKNNIKNLSGASRYTPAQLELLEMFIVNDAQEMAEEFMLIHDIALYHSDYNIHDDEKIALYNLKQLSDILKQISSEMSSVRYH